ASLDASLFCLAGKLIVGRLSGTALTFCNFLVKQKVKKRNRRFQIIKTNVFLFRHCEGLPEAIHKRTFQLDCFTASGSQ
ncbi:MAG: hypothetical protein LBL79_03365, partial [Prevotella sp.]|nr:hypothetical protein [Prevotella sp.]